jgi:hypothetical protein
MSSTAGANVWRPNLRRDASTSAIMAGFIAVAISYAGPLLVTLEAALAADLSPQLTASWVWAISVGSGVACLIFSWVTRQPVMVAWSIPGAALLIIQLGLYPFSGCDRLGDPAPWRGLGVLGPVGGGGGVRNPAKVQTKQACRDALMISGARILATAAPEAKRRGGTPCPRDDVHRRRPVPVRGVRGRPASAVQAVTGREDDPVVVLSNSRAGPGVAHTIEAHDRLRAAAWRSSTTLGTSRTPSSRCGSPDCCAASWTPRPPGDRQALRRRILGSPPGPPNP